MLAIYIFVRSFLATRLARDDRGQASAEYALVLLGAAGVALLVLAWTKKTDRVGHLLDVVFDRILGRAK